MQCMRSHIRPWAQHHGQDTPSVGRLVTVGGFTYVSTHGSALSSAVGRGNYIRVTSRVGVSYVRLHGHTYVVAYSAQTAQVPKHTEGPKRTAVLAPPLYMRAAALAPLPRALFRAPWGRRPAHADVAPRAGGPVGSQRFPLGRSSYKRM